MTKANRPNIKSKTTGGIIIALIIIALVFLGIRFLPPAYQVMKQADATPFEAKILTFRKDAKQALTNTPNKEIDTIATDQSQIHKPGMIIFYKINCPFCEAAHQAIESKIKAVNTTSGRGNIVFVNVESDLGKKLVEKYNIQYAASITILNKQGKSFNFTQAALDNKNNHVADNDSINKAFAKYASLF